VSGAPSTAGNVAASRWAQGRGDFAIDAEHTLAGELHASPRHFRRALVARIARLGVLRSTILLTLASAIGSLALTSLWLLASGASAVGDALYITLFVAVPMTAVGAGICLSLLVALEDARQRVQALAMTDALTGLANRRHFLAVAQRELALAQRHDLPLALLVLDIEHFKRVNDDHGHVVGDEVIVEIGRRFSATLRSTDLLARWGGEEFIALLPNTPEALAQQLAERLRSAAAAAIHLPPGQTVEVTVSVGVVGRSPGSGPLPTLDGLAQAADRAMYDAKNQGRDRVSVAV
jgi:diguanylate cyclase (GGDEF)-like protein